MNKTNVIKALVLVALIQAGLLTASVCKINRQEAKIRNQARTIAEADTLMYNLIDGYPVHYGED